MLEASLPCRAYPARRYARRASPGHHPPSGGYVRLGGMKALSAVVAELGGSLAAIAEELGFDSGFLDDADAVVSYRDLGSLLFLAGERTGCETLGLSAGARADLTSFDPEGEFGSDALSVGAALESLIDLHHRHSRGTVLRLRTVGDITTLEYGLYEQVERGRAAICDFALSSTVAAIRQVIGDRWTPCEVLLPRSVPVRRWEYWNIFRAPVRFNEDRAALVFPTELLAIPVCRQAQSSPVRIDARAAARPVPFSESLRRTLRAEILEGRCSAESMAAHLSIHRRTLHRWLLSEGLTFKIVLNEVRSAIACQLLSDTDIAIATIAASLEFSEPAAFTRAFRRWTGETPSEWRAQQGTLQETKRKSHLS